MGYRALPEAIPVGGFIVAEIHLGGTATLHTQWGGRDGWVDMPYVPIEPLPTGEALILGSATSTKHNVPFYIRLDEGTQWLPEWGNLEAD